jgi:hypothetical protein
MLQQFLELPPIYRDIALVLAEIVLALTAFLLLRLVARAIFRRIAAGRPEKSRARLSTIMRNITALLVLILSVAVLTLVA